MEQSDYHSLLSRAILKIDGNTPQARSELYDRARQVLRNQLEASQPRVPEAAVRKELQQLEGAIQQLETQQKAQPGSTGRGQPAPQQSRSVASRGIFCVHCSAETTDETPGDVSTINGIGRQFYGSAAPCPECASVVRTLWWTVAHVPLVPLASYRYKTAEERVTRARFWCRKLPSRHWQQIWKTWAIGLSAAIAVGIGFYIYHSYKS